MIKLSFKKLVSVRKAFLISKATMFYQLKSSMSTFTRIKILKTRSSKPMTQLFQMKMGKVLTNKRYKDEPRNDKNVTAIVGHSLVKDLFGWELSDKNEKVFVKRRSTSVDPADQLKKICGLISPPLTRDPSRVIMHAGTNDLRSSQDPETIVKNMKDIAKNSMNDKN